MLATLLTFLVMGIVAAAVLGVVLAVIGVAIGLAGFLLFKVLPLVAIGYVAVRLLAPKQKQLSSEDQKWLDS
jgi:membrane protein implicated in regulation of membrane protease activity